MSESTEDASGSGTVSTNGQTPQAATTDEAQRAGLVVNAQYVKDLSFEAPNAPGVFSKLSSSKPDIGIKVDVKAQNLGSNIYEVVLHVQAECKAGDTLAFVLELAYGGVFTLHVPAEATRPILLIECPRLLFPFARQIIADATLNGGFLPLMLAPVDFAGLYQRHQVEDGTANPDPDTALV